MNSKIIVTYDDVSYNLALELFECLKTVVSDKFHIYDCSKYFYNGIAYYDNFLLFTNENVIDDDITALLLSIDNSLIGLVNNKLDKTVSDETLYNDVMLLLREYKIKKMFDLNKYNV